jgi:hypothetical protein
MLPDSMKHRNFMIERVVLDRDSASAYHSQTTGEMTKPMAGRSNIAGRPITFGLSPPSPWDQAHIHDSRLSHSHDLYEG